MSRLDGLIVIWILMAGTCIAFAFGGWLTDVFIPAVWGYSDEGDDQL